MSKSKRADLQKKYLTNNEKQPHVRVFRDLYFSPAFMALTHTAQIVYIGLLLFSGIRASASLIAHSRRCAPRTHLTRRLNSFAKKDFLNVSVWDIGML